MEGPSTGEMDAWLAQARQCKYLSEPDIKKLCEYVRTM